MEPYAPAHAAGGARRSDSDGGRVRGRRPRAEYQGFPVGAGDDETETGNDAERRKVTTERSKGDGKTCARELFQRDGYLFLGNLLYFCKLYVLKRIVHL